jgi:hypothetical protein
MLSLYEMERQILGYYNLATKTERVAGITWYADALTECEMLASLYFLPVKTVVGMVAALSPRNRWSFNVTDAEQVIVNGENATVHTFPANLTKAVRILNGEQPTDVLRGNKVCSFYHCILDAETYEVCVDGHAYGVACGFGERIQVKTISDTAYERISTAYANTAHHLGLEPRQLQATTWLTYRRIHNIY